MVQEYSIAFAFSFFFPPSPHTKNKYLNLGKIVQGYGITYFCLRQDPVVLSEFSTSLTTIAVSNKV